MYDSVGALTEAIITKVVASATGYTAENTAVYDVKLQISTDGGVNWVDATEENYPASGITVTLPYPDGTDSTYDFTVVHMFTVTSEKLNTVAGDTEMPTVTKSETGITFTLHGLSPVAIAWKEGTTTATSAATATAAATTGTNNVQTGDDSVIGLWLTILSLAAAGLIGIVVVQKKGKKSAK